MPKLDEFLQIAEAADYLGVCKNTLRNWGLAGKLKEYRHPINNYRLYKKSELERLLNKLQSPTTKKRHPK